ncbi:MAG: hypothetical protein GY847_30295 [Proteobacteria bacterium]|nr:hypothetical protein [Pseudomonadota bacterium]
MKRITQGLILLILAVGFSGQSIANEYTDVIDAFDKEYNDPFDLNLSVGYERFQRSATIRRENTDSSADPHNWDYYAYRTMFKSKQVSHMLHMNLEVGIYKDLSLKFRLPLILNDKRELRAHSDWNNEWRDLNGDGASDADDALFRLPLISADRSGVDYFAVGLWWGILDQGRDDTKPNWTFYAEGRFGVGKQLEAACSMAGGDSCGSIGYKPNTKSGISRGLNEFAFGTRLSRRYGLFDPYFGIEALVGWAKDGSLYFNEGERSGQLNKMPPVVGTLDFGLEIIPWEVPEKHLKFSINVGGTGKYYSEGREYTPLFDALGTSEYFVDKQDYVDFNGNDVNDQGHEHDAARPGVWTGMTDVENYAMFQGKLILMIQPAKYIKFHLGTGFGHETEHFITKTDQCRYENLKQDVATGMSACTNPNYGHRPGIDDPGNRFRAEKTFLWTFLVDAVAMF